MEATALSVGKSVLDGALGYAKSAVAEEVALQLGIQRDHAFIRDELSMMQAFLRAAHGERDDHEVLMTWVKQVRDVAYDAEDCLQNFSIHLHNQSWWHLPRTLRERRRIAKQMKELRARVEDVSQRNLRYQLINSASSKPVTSADEKPNIAAAGIYGINDARRAGKKDNSKVDLVQLINQEGEDLRVIAVWGTSSDLGQTSIIKAVYDNPDIKGKFAYRAWVRVMHPFNAKDFVQSLVKQFRSTVGFEGLLEEDKTWQELAEELKGYVNEKGYLVVLNDLSTIEEWDDIKVCFPNYKKGSRIIVCTPQVEVASLCLGQESQVLELKQFSTDQTIYAFYEKDGTDSPTLLPSSDAATTSTLNLVVPTNEILENQSKGSKDRKVVRNNLTRIKTMTNALEESKLIGREKEASDVAGLISDKLGQQFLVISIWGMGGLGKTTLIKDVYQNQHLIGMFEKCVFVTVMRPFILKELLKSLIMQLHTESSEERRSIMDLRGGTRKELPTMGVEALIKEVARLLEGFKCLIVLDDLSSTTEWDMVVQSFPKMENTSRIIITTREENIAKYCSEKQENIYKLKILGDKDALDLFTRKVFKEAIDLEQRRPDLIEEAKLILKKCNGLPLAIVTIGGFLVNQPKTAMEWRKLNEHISAELEINPELEAIRTILSKSYDGLPYHLKSCFLYLSIFPEDHKLSRRRLTRRWTAEGYSREIREKSAEEIADRYFMELIGRSMILPCHESAYSRKGFDSCQVHDLMREISISKSTEENLVFRLEEGCRSNTHGTVRHLTINSNWEGDKRDFESMVDMNRIRSLTVFGKWRPFFISNKMSLLRILDLENIDYLYDRHLEQIGKLHHLQYLSLRRCNSIFRLPDSLGNLKQLQTLDIKQTSIRNLPKTIINLRKLHYIHATIDYSIILGCSTSGFRKLRLLRTLSVVNIAVGQGILKEIKALTQLRRLAVIGIDKKNCGEFCSTLADLRCLESLTVHSMSEPDLQGCLDGVSSPPKNLQSLMVRGNLAKLPEWIGGLNSLVKLKLKETMLSELDATIQVLGKLPNLAILRLLKRSFKGKELNLTFRRETFPSLMVLQLALPDLRSVEFGEEATPKLELLSFIGYPLICKAGMFSGLASLPSLKEFMLDNDKYEEDFLTHVQDQLDGNPNGPVMKSSGALASNKFVEALFDLEILGQSQWDSNDSPNPS
uniref:NB-ARC domain-containing protein n=1 Tax=Setaria italica TaxID=4555 RepID=K3YFW4_SETIT